MYGDTYFTKFLNQRQNASLSLPPIILKWAKISLRSDKIIFKKKGGDIQLISCFTQRQKIFTIVHHMCLIKLGGKFLFNTVILLGSTWVVYLRFIPIHSCLQTLSKLENGHQKMISLFQNQSGVKPITHYHILMSLFNLIASPIFGLSWICGFSCFLAVDQLKIPLTFTMNPQYLCSQWGTLVRILKQVRMLS